MTEWTEAEDETLRKMVAEGWTYEMVARAIGRSKSACIGRYRRISGIKTASDYKRVESRGELRNKFERGSNGYGAQLKDSAYAKMCKRGSRLLLQALNRYYSKRAAELGL